MNTFFKSQFSYFPLSWMFHNRKLNNKINRLHERCLRVIYNDSTSSFTELLEIDNSISVHHRNIQVFATELYKFVNSLSPKPVSGCFKLNNMTACNTRNKCTFYSRPIRTLAWHRITPPLGTKNLGNCVKWYENPFNTYSFQKSSRLVSFNLWIYNQIFLHGFLFYVDIYYF